MMFERDVQDAFHATLRLFFDDVRAEPWTPPYDVRGCCFNINPALFTKNLLNRETIA
ncbi:PD-(D/E)XK nuclease domain-containing protein [Rhodopirellula bahusiensis]|uniref:PD-(D/E)XK nuclease domain-containing protein n=1 Tax=Rhodopirellula bahusiensis TaxID=2014065 RepID=UPI0013047B19